MDESEHRSEEDRSVTLSLSEAIEGAESVLGRGLTGDEVTLVGRMVSADRGMADILQMLDREVEQPADDVGKTHRFEAVGDKVREIE